MAVNIEDDVPVRLDPRLTATALAHLLENAAQYSPPGSTIEVSVRLPDEGLTIAVRDHGPGIAAPDLPHVFERFYRGGEARTRDVWDWHGPLDCPRVAGGRARTRMGRELPDGGAQFTIVVPVAVKDQSEIAFTDVMTQGPRILLVDDETAIQRSVGPLLRSRGYDVEIAARGRRRSRRSRRGLLAWSSSISACRISKGPKCAGAFARRRQVPIIVLSARGAEADKVNALDLGADDYVTKPFGPEELLARIRVALRRVAADADESRETGLLEVGSLTIDYDRRRVVRDGTEIRLTPKEFDLLSLLARHHDRVLTHRAILKVVWGPNAVEQPEHLWTLVAQLRKKIEPDPAKPQYLISEPWVGYRFVTEAS